MKYKDVWPLADGSLAVRPGLEAFSTKESHWLGSYRVDTTDRMRYLLAYRQSGLVTLTVLNEQFEVVQAISWGNAEVGIGSIAVVQGQVFVAMPGLPTLWGYADGALDFLKRPARGVIRSKETLDVPQGFVCSWAGRLVASDGWRVWFSDPLLPRAMVADNVLNPEGGAVHGVFSVGGRLYIVTSSAVLALDISAAAMGPLVFGSVSQVRDFRSTGPGSACVCAGRLWGLTESGIAVIDTPQGEEVKLVEPNHYTTRRERIAPRGLASGFVVHAAEDYMVVRERQRSERFFLVDGRTGFAMSSETSSSAETVSGIAVDEIGRILIGTSRYLFGMIAGGGELFGGIIIERNSGEGEDARLRQVHVLTDCGFTYVANDDSMDEVEAQVHQSPILGTDSWDTIVYREAMLASNRHDIAQRSDEHAIEAGASRAMARIDVSPGLDRTSVSPERP